MAIQPVGKATQVSNSNESVAMQRIFSDVPSFGYAMAMGKDTLTDVGDRLFRAALSDPGITPEITGPLYDAIRAEAVTVGLSKHKPMKDQTRKSRNSQVSKLANFPQMAGYAQDNDAVVAAYEWLRTPAADPADGLGVSGYTKVVACLVEMGRVLVADRQASEADLRDAIVTALTPEREEASVAAQRVADAWQTLVHGSEKTPAAFQPEFAALLAANPHDPAKQVQAALDAIVAWHKGREEAADRAAKLAAGGLSQ